MPGESERGELDRRPPPDEQRQWRRHRQQVTRPLVGDRQDDEERDEKPREQQAHDRPPPPANGGGQHQRQHQRPRQAHHGRIDQEIDDPRPPDVPADPVFPDHGLGERLATHCEKRHHPRQRHQRERQRPARVPEISQAARALLAPQPDTADQERQQPDRALGIDGRRGGHVERHGRPACLLARVPPDDERMHRRAHEGHHQHVGQDELAVGKKAVGGRQREAARQAGPRAEQSIADQEGEDDRGERGQRDGKLGGGLGDATARERGQRDEPGQQRRLLAEELGAHLDVERRLAL